MAAKIRHRRKICAGFRLLPVLKKCYLYIDAYDLIMKNKELLLDRNPKKSPVRFIFSHSALREGRDNPNVFQICTLKNSSGEVRKRQEVGRGLRLSVNQDGERMDVNALGNDVNNVNVLTVIASESYDGFAKGLQTEMADAVANRPKSVTAELFIGKTVTDKQGNVDIITEDVAREIWFGLRMEGYIDKQGRLTDKYHEDKLCGKIRLILEKKEPKTCFRQFESFLFLEYFGIHLRKSEKMKVRKNRRYLSKSPVFFVFRPDI